MAGNPQIPYFSGHYRTSDRMPSSITAKQGRERIQTMRRFFILPVLALVLAACGTGSSSDDLKATRAAALTGFAMPTNTLPLPTETITPTPTVEPTATLSTPSATRTATRPAAVIAPPCDDSAFVRDVTIPDGTVMKPGEEFIKTWSFLNTGTCSWTTAYAIAFVGGNAMDGVITYMPIAVDPGGVIDISIGLAAPAAPGTHTGNWRLKNADGAFFGASVYVQIVVPGSASTTAPEITNTLEPTPAASGA
jgi:hypothetical protein